MSNHRTGKTRSSMRARLWFRLGKRSQTRGQAIIEYVLILALVTIALIGVVIFWLCFAIIDKLTPHDLWLEIVEKQNKALALVVAAMCLGISIIVAAAIH